MKRMMIMVVLTITMVLTGCMTASGKMIDDYTLQLYGSVNDKMELRYDNHIGVPYPFMFYVSSGGQSASPSIKIFVDDEAIKFKYGDRWSAGRQQTNIHVYGNTGYGSVNTVGVYSTFLYLEDEQIEKLLQATKLESVLFQGRSEQYRVALTSILPQIKEFINYHSAKQ